MKRVLALILLSCFLLSGCSTWLDGSYSSVKPHEEKPNNSGSQTVAVSSYAALYRTLRNLVYSGSDSGVISVRNYNQLVVARDTRYAIQNLKLSDPIGAYAVEDITFQLGTNAGQPAIAVSISYYHGRSELQKIPQLENMTQAQEAVAKALEDCESGIVLYVEDFQSSGFAQWVEDYADNNPDKVMEKPQVVENVYPETGKARVLELKFTYQNSREKLRTMQQQVDARLRDALRETGGEQTQLGHFQSLYQWLGAGIIGWETSITPAYSLLLHGVGDSKAVSTVYAALCHRAGLECIAVTGTYQGEPRYWNIVCIDGAYFHVDLLRGAQEGAFHTMTDSEMSSYVWDYSDYPKCTGQAPTEK